MDRYIVREDQEGTLYELNYFRDRNKREVDFVITKDKKPIALIEAKWSDKNISKSLSYVGEKLKQVRQIQIVGELEYPYEKGSVQVRSAEDALTKFDSLE